ncbi:hypothetical protein [Alicyclobacillus fodiniaquatilis]|uniref:Uncharacterized protein n=1 Tax=Alicyclobacillus fodiniaquatilis TaxID=1661150 RepID=A0ABW4JCK8_9BACL
MNSSIIVDTEDVQKILEQCGPQSLAVYIGLQALGNPSTLEEIKEFCGMSLEATTEAAIHLGLHNLGIIIEEKSNQLRLAR